MQNYLRQIYKEGWRS